jgi:hypothetical protein
VYTIEPSGSVPAPVPGGGTPQSVAALDMSLVFQVFHLQ